MFKDIALCTKRYEPKSTFIVCYGVYCCGLMFKLGAVPFHMWLPDVYGWRCFIGCELFRIGP